MGNGRSRNYYSRTIGGLRDNVSADLYESLLTKEDYRKLYDYLYYGVYGISDTLSFEERIEQLHNISDISEADQKLIDELRKTGTDVDLGISSKELRSLGVPEEICDTMRAMLNRYGLSKVEDFSINYSLGYYTPKNSQEEKVLKFFDDNSVSISVSINNKMSGIRDLTNFLSKLDEEDVGIAYREINTHLSTLSTLNKVANRVGIPSVSELMYDDDIKQPKAGGRYSPYSDIIHVSPQYLTTFSTRDFFGAGNDPSQNNWNMGMDFPQGLIIHEFGHHVENKVFRLNSRVKGSSAVSSYGNASSREAFAEAFTAYCFGVTPINGSEYYSNFKTLMRSKGLQSFEGLFSPSGLKQKPTVSTTKVTTKVTTPKATPVKTETPKVSTPKTPTIKNNTPKVRTASNFTKSSTSISGTIRGKNFTATITDGIRNRGYIERTVGSTKYRIDINTGAFTKID